VPVMAADGRIDFKWPTIRIALCGEQPSANSEELATMSATNKVLSRVLAGLLGVAAIERFLSAGWEVS